VNGAINRFAKLKDVIMLPELKDFVHCVIHHIIERKEWKKNDV